LILLPRSDTALEDCRKHLSDFPDTDPAVTAYLVRHVSVLLCNEIEAALTQLIIDRVDRGCDEGAANLVKTVRGGLVRNARPKEMRDAIHLFGEPCGQLYDRRIEEKVGDEGLSRLGTLVSHRNLISHSTPADLTFSELERAYKAAAGLLEAAREALETEIDGPMAVAP
jgi:hypothetical protein